MIRASLMVAVAGAFIMSSEAPGARSCVHRFTQREQTVYVHAVYHRRVVSGAARARLNLMERCAASARARGNMRAVRRLSARARAVRRSITPYPGPGGPWALPWPIVRCESEGRNLPPNGAGASGFYQFLGSTFRANGGPTSAAYLSSRAVQDRIAARLWAGGRNASQWVCAGIVVW